MPWETERKGFCCSKRFSMGFLSCDYFEIVGFESIMYVNDFIRMVCILFKRWGYYVNLSM